MRHPLKDFRHHVKLLLAEIRHTAERTIAPNEGMEISGPQISQLEQRLMMSASPAAVVATPNATEAAASPVSVDSILDQVFHADNVVKSQSTADSVQDSQNSTHTLQLVVIDSTIPDPESWVAELRQDSATAFDVLVLSGKRNGFEEIADSLDGTSKYSAIHLVSHGSAGQITLGDSTLDLESLGDYESELERWKLALAPDADVLIYGCELAADADGQQLVQSLSDIWNADVAASDDLTGHQSLSADWDLEYHSGLIQAPIAFSDFFTETWVGILPTNAAPVNSVPDGQVVLQDRILSFNSASGTTISVSDSDAGTSDLRVTLSANRGTFTITDVGAARYETGDGFDDSVLVLEGTTAELNFALQHLHYTAGNGFVGVAEITVTTDDLGNGGTADPAQDTDVISVFVHDEFNSGSYAVATTGVDELNRQAHRGVSRSLAAGPNGDLISVWRTSANNVFYAIHNSNNSTVATGQINDLGTTATDIAVASGSDGSFVVAWSQDSGTGQDIFAQRFWAAGIAIGSRITVDSSAGIQQAVTIDRNAAGDFVVAWESPAGGIGVRRFTANGSAIDVTSLSPTGSTGGTNASVGIDREQNLLVGWDDPNGQYVQRFDGTNWNTKHTLSFLPFASGSAIAMNENGQAVIAWHQLLGNWMSQYQLIANDGSLNGTALLTPSDPGGDEVNPSVAMDEEGNFVIAWGTNGDIQARRFAANGYPLGSDITISSASDFEDNAAVAVLDINNFAVMYTRHSASADVYVSRISQAANDAANPVIDLASSTVGTANTPITQRFLVGDDVTDASALNFGVTSTDTSLISLGNISVVGTGLYRDLVITPTADMIGVSNVTVSVTDGDGNTTSKTIEVFVASPTITVTTTVDEVDGNTSSIIDLLASPGGTGISLREAIAAANNTPNYGRQDRIEFNIPGASEQTISLTSLLPTITDSVFIDGQSQHGYLTTPLIGVNGASVNGNGLTIESDDVVVRGLAIFGFGQSGFDVDTGNGVLIEDSNDVAIYGNHIGVDQTGLTDAGNDRNGIRIIGESHRNIIGGDGLAYRNVISANNASGIAIRGSAGNPSSQNQISFNYVGVGSDGLVDLGNSFSGIEVQYAHQTEILNNVLSGNSDSGIELKGGPTTETKIQGNLIGVASDGTTALGNDGDGIALYTLSSQGPSQTQIGGIASGEANVIANNSLIGVRLDSGGGIGNTIRGNQIYNNSAGLGIDLLGVNGNDLGDADSGTNGQQNTPVLDFAELASGDLTVQGTLNSTANTVFDIDIYSSAVADPSGAGEAETFLGSFSLSTDSSGNAAFHRVIAGATTLSGHQITATATSSVGNTSEFSQNVTVENLSETAPVEAFWFSTVSDVNNASGATGASSWSSSEAMVLGDPNLAIGSGTTAGHLSSAFDLENFAQGGDAVLSALHVVSKDITVGTATSVSLKAGDILFSTASAETFNGGSLTTDQHDLVLFHPDTADDYSSGTFSVLLDGIGGSGSFEFLLGATLVEETTTIGDTVVDAGDFLFVSMQNSENNIVKVFEVDSVGEGTTVGTTTSLLDGDDLGISGTTAIVTGLELIENTTTIGGQTLNSGTLLVITNDAPSDLSTANNDIFALHVTQTEIGSGASAASSSMVVRGADIGLTRLSAISLGRQTASVATASIVADATLDDENDSTNYGSDNTLVVDKSGSDLGDQRAALRFDLSGLPTNAVITSAQLQLEATSVSDPFKIQTYELTESWTESTTTFSERDTGSNWSDSGGTVDSTVIDAVTVTAAGTYQWDLTSLVQAWHDGSTVNNGVLLGSSESGSEDAVFGSRESSTPPQLIIEYTTDANSPPIASSGGSYSINEGDSLALDASGTTDADGDTLTYAWDLNNDGIFDDATGVSPTIAWSSLPSTIRDDGSYSISVSVSDGISSDVVSTAVLTVTNVAPTGTADSGATLQTTEGSSLTITDLLSNDSDPAGASDPLTISAINTTSTTGTVTILSGTSVQYDPNGQFEFLRPGESASDTFTYTVQDDDGGSDSDVTVTVTVTGQNDQPTSIDLSNATVAEAAAGAAVGTLSTVDPDTTDSHTYTVDDNRFEVTGNNLKLKAGQSIDYEAEQSVSLDVTSTDPNGLSTTRSFTISVQDANDSVPVVAGGQVFQISESVTTGSSVGTVSASDADSVGSVQGYAIDGGNSSGVFAIDSVTGEITVANQTQLDAVAIPFYELNISVSDGTNRSASVPVRINVSDANTAPVANNDTFSLNEGQTLTANAVSDWFNPSWKNRQQISIDNNGIASALTDYPLRLRFHATASDAITINYSDFQADGTDLVFVDPDGTILAYEIEHWDPAGYSEVWVRVPQIDGASVDSIMMYYNSSSANPSPLPKDTWRASDAAVIHLNADTTDSSGNMAAGNANDVVTVPGIIGGGASFDGTNSEIRYDHEDSTVDVFDGGGTISAWINLSGWGGHDHGAIVDKAASTFLGNAKGAGWGLQANGTGTSGRIVLEQGFTGDIGRWATPMGTISLNTWQHVAVVYDSSSSTNAPRIFIDGIEQSVIIQDAPSGTFLSDANNDLVIGNYSKAAIRTADGIIDEVRIQTTAATPAEIAAEYRDIVAPVVTSGSVQTGPSGLLGNDTDPDADELTVSLITGPSHAESFSLLADGSFTYAHDGSETTSDSFTYRITDGVSTDTATVTLSIAAQNDQAPVITAGQTFSIAETAPVGTSVGTVVATDADAETTFSNWTIVSGNNESHFQINAATGKITLSPTSKLDYENRTSFDLQISVSDGVNTASTETVTVQIVDANDQVPVITAGQTFSIAETAPVGTSVGTVVATDADAETTFSNWTIVSGNTESHFQINAATGKITLSPTSKLDYENRTSFDLQISVSDGVNTASTETVTVQIVDANDQVPVITAGQTFSIAETAPVGTSVGTVVATDADAETTFSNWTIVSGNTESHFQINAATGKITLSPTSKLDYENQTSFDLQISVSDGDNTASTETVTVQIVDANDQVPVITAGQTFSIAETAPVGTSVGTVVATDADAETTFSNWTIVSGNTESHFQINAATGKITLSPASKLDYENRTSFDLQISVSDGVNTASTETVTIVVIDVNLPPEQSTIDDQTLDEDSPGESVAISVADPDTDVSSLVLTATSGNPAVIQESGLTFTGTGTSRQLIMTPVAGISSGSSVITVTVNDGTQSVSQTFTVSIAAVNDAPVIASIADQRVDEDGQLEVSLNVSDVDNTTQQLTFSATSSDPDLISASGLKFPESPNSPVLRITPMADQSGSATISVTVSDGMDSTTETFIVIVNEVNDAPTLSSKTLKFDVTGTELQLTEAKLFSGVTDIDSSNLTFILTTAPENGSLVRNADGQFIYKPNLGFTGVDKFDYVVSDGFLQTENREVSLKIAPSVPAPGLGSVLPSTSTSSNSQNTSDKDDQTESKSENQDESSSENQSSNQAAGSANRLSNKSGSANRSNDQQDADNAMLVRQESDSKAPFVFRKLIAIDLANQANIKNGGIRDESVRESGASRQNAQQQPAPSDNNTTPFQQNDWQYYSDLTSTVKGVDNFQANLQNDYALMDLTTGTITFAGSSIVVGTVVTAIRSGMLALGFLSQLPVWTMFDPLMVVDGISGEEGDSLEDIVDRQAKQQEQQEQQEQTIS